MVNAQIFVGNLPFSTTDEELNALFAEHGEIVRAEVAAFPEGKSKGYGIVLYSAPNEAEAAIAALHEYTLGGRALEVRMDRGSNKEFYDGRQGPNDSRFKRSAPAVRENASVSSPEHDEDVEGRQVFVGNLPFSFRWQELKDLFREAGDVSHARILGNGRRKGTGVVLFATKEDAAAAIDHFNGHNLRGRELEVREYTTEPPRDEARDNKERSPSRSPSPERSERAERPELSERPERTERPERSERSERPERPERKAAEPGARLYVGNLPFSYQWQDLKDLFRECGEVIRADVVTDSNGKSRGYGQVVMGSAEEAQAAIQEMNGKDVEGREIEVREDKFAESASSTQVFVGNLPYSTRWQDLKDIFRQYDVLPTHADVMMEPHSGRSKGCGIVRFNTKEEAETAVESVNGKTIHGRQLIVRFDKYA